ncbi:unnamed protein product [Leptidea sinapis]|uniref:Protein sidekick n=1 Tax=Leptidea sinapis TaxID=189913 RepID=A0A5E4R3E8_9NEOP|nr:unnamed protein product [Leptidea sinapis]
MDQRPLGPRRHEMGDHNAHQQRHAGRVHDLVPEPAALDGVLVPRDRVQHVRNQHALVQRQGDRDAVQVVPGVRLPAAPALLPPHLVHGGAGGRLHHHHHHEEAQRTLEESLGETEERGSLALDLYRSRAGSTTATGASNSTTLRRKTPAALSKCPPRPSPASVAYHSDEESLRGYDENPDDSSLTEKPSEISSSDSQNSESENESVRSEPHSFVNHYANVNDTLRQSWKRQRPVKNYSSYTDSEPEGSAVVSLNGGHIVMNNMARSRAPLPGFSSFV